MMNVPRNNFQTQPKNIFNLFLCTTCNKNLYYIYILFYNINKYKTI